MSEFNSSAHSRLMFCPATAATYYPTAVTLGLSGSTLKVHGDTRDTTQANSFFVDPNTSTAADLRKGFLLKRLVVLTAGAGSTIDIQGHNGTNLLPQFSGATAGTLLDLTRDDIPIWGGFRVVLTGASSPLVLLQYAIFGRS